MDLSQDKLTKAEWKSIEIPVSHEEQNILKLIVDGFANPDIHHNHTLTLYSFLKITATEAMDVYLYTQFFQSLIEKPTTITNKTTTITNKTTTTTNKYPAVIIPVVDMTLLKKNKIKKADIIRIENMKQNLEENKNQIFEFILIQFCQKIQKSLLENTAEYLYYLYSLVQFRKSQIAMINPLITQYVENTIRMAEEKAYLPSLVLDAQHIIEKNPYLLKYADLQLFSHQKDLFRLFNNQQPDTATIPRLVLYIAPTGTGKTLSPLGLTQNGMRVLFVCSARHVGLSLAKSAISIEKRVAFAYGCNTAEDIRLHNFAAVDYVKNKRTGGIGKIDNSNGSRVDIMICDVKSYLIAMEYMLEFHLEENLLLYWDEPTITMDYDKHDLHEIIHQNWAKNRVSKIVLSCATLPHQEEIQPTLDNYLLRFVGDNSAGLQRRHIQSIVSYDCKKTISMLNTKQCCVLPHLLFPDYGDLLHSVAHCMKHKTLLRYFDLEEITRFLKTAVSTEDIHAHFHNIAGITIASIKMYYLKVLMEMDETKWHGVYLFLTTTQQPKFKPTTTAENELKKSVSLTTTTPHTTSHTTLYNGGGGGLTRTQSVFEPIPKKTILETTTTQNNPAVIPSPFQGILFSTADAHTLTDGPTLYIAENVEKMGLFYIHQTQIPPAELAQLMEKIHFNNTLQEKIQQVENQIEDQLGKEIVKEKKMEKEQFNREVKALKGQLELLKSQMQFVGIRDDFVPNTCNHLKKWCGAAAAATIGQNAFAPQIDEDSVVRIMSLQVSDVMKVLLLLGMGVFVLDAPIAYVEIIKQLAAEQKLFLIIASSDYIYGTNYPFCHGIIGKDLQKMTQQKTIQAMGRIGRNNIQQEYTVRFRNEEILRNLFLPMTCNKEAENMCQLFNN